MTHDEIKARLADAGLIVKPLFWQRRGDGVYSAETDNGHFYDVCGVGKGRWIAHHIVHGLGRRIGPLTHYTKHDAQAVCQADHERRVCKALEGIRK